VPSNLVRSCDGSLKSFVLSFWQFLSAFVVWVQTPLISSSPGSLAAMASPGSAEEKRRHAVDEGLQMFRDLVGRHGNWFAQPTRQKVAQYAWGARESSSCQNWKERCPRPGKEGDYWLRFFKTDHDIPGAPQPANEREKFLAAFALSIVNLNAKVKQGAWFHTVLIRLSEMEELVGLSHDDLCVAFEDLVMIVAVSLGVQSALCALDRPATFPTLPPISGGQPPRRTVDSWTRRVRHPENTRMPVVLAGDTKPGFAPADSPEAWAATQVSASFKPFSGPTITPENLAVMLKLAHLFYMPATSVGKPTLFGASKLPEGRFLSRASMEMVAGAAAGAVACDF